MGFGVIEINTVPRFKATDSEGVIYTKIPRLQFLINENGATVLMPDATLYSKDAIYQPLQNWFAEGNTTLGKFQTSASHTPECSTNQSVYDQGPNATKLSGMDSYFQETMLRKSSYGLKWKMDSKNGMGWDIFLNISERMEIK